VQVFGLDQETDARVDLTSYFDLKNSGRGAASGRH
jgi:hypothetical protein